jgi:hypothetical protein
MERDDLAHVDVQQRLRAVERALATQRRVTAALAALALVGGLAAFRRADPEVVRARRFEVVDAEGRNVAGFGVGCAAFTAAKGDPELIGWYLKDPGGEATATAFVGQIGSGSEKVPNAMLALSAEPGYLQAFAMKEAASVEVYCGEEKHCAGLRAQSDHCAIDLEAPPGDGSGGEPVTVLALSHSSGKPTIEGWDDEGNETIDIK